MTSLEFIHERLSFLVREFPELKCSYVYDDLAYAHLVEIKPSEFYKDNSDILTFEMLILADFINAYSHETLTFLDENDILKVSNPSFVIMGDLYETTSLISEFENVNIYLPNNQGSLLTYELDSVVISSAGMSSSMEISNDYHVAMAA